MALLMNGLHFLSGLPRSGSTVLAAILNQNPSVMVSTTSSLADSISYLCSPSSALQLGGLEISLIAEKIKDYCQSVEKPIAINKSRKWPLPEVISKLDKVLGRSPKIIATVRPPEECMASLVRIAKPEPIDEFILNSPLCGHLIEAYNDLKKGHNTSPDSILFVEYDDLIDCPKRELARIHDFLQLPDFQYNFNKISGESVKEDDERLYGVSGLHDIRSKLEKKKEKSPKEVLGGHYLEYCLPEFWTTTQVFAGATA